MSNIPGEKRAAVLIWWHCYIHFGWGQATAEATEQPLCAKEKQNQGVNQGMTKHRRSHFMQQVHTLEGQGLAQPLLTYVKVALLLASERRPVHSKEMEAALSYCC